MKQRDLVKKLQSEASNLNGMVAITIFTDGVKMRSKYQDTKKSTKI